jgi:hypothetical protein
MAERLADLIIEGRERQHQGYREQTNRKPCRARGSIEKEHRDRPLLTDRAAHQTYGEAVEQQGCDDGAGDQTKPQEPEGHPAENVVKI